MKAKKPAALSGWLLWLGCLAWAGWVGAAQSARSEAPNGTADFAFVQPWFENVGDADTFLGGSVTALAQDSRGLIWIGTQRGLIRYDGYRFRHFTHNVSNNSLAGNYVLSLWAAKDGRLWVGSVSDGLSVFDPESERFEHFKHDAKQVDSVGAGRISALTGDAQGGLWIATDQGLDYLPKNGKGFVHHRHDEANPRSLFNDKIRSIMINRQGRLFVGTTAGLQRLAQDGRGFEALAQDINVHSLFEAQDGKLWLGTTRQGAAWLAPDSGTLHWLALSRVGQAEAGSAVARGDALSHPWISGMAQVQADQIWLASQGGGINIVAAADGKVLQHLRHDPALPSSLALDAVKPMLLDRAGTLWVGTWGGGLQRFNGQSGLPRWLRHGQAQAGGLSHPDIRSVLELVNGQILFGSEGNGIDIFDRRRGLIGGYRAGHSPGALPDTAITSIAQTKDGTLWAGTRQAGVVRMAADSREWQTVPGLTQAVHRLVGGRDGGLWAATTRGVAHWQVGRAQFQALPDDKGKPMHSPIVTLVEDRQGRVWAGGNNGLWVMEPGATGLHPIHPEPDRADSLISNYITSLLLDSRGRLWLATDKGLERLLQWDGKVARFEHISALLGRPGQDLGENLLEDKAGRIWSATALIDPEKMRILPIGVVDGVQLGTSWVGSYGKTDDGLLIFGGSQGASIIDPQLFRIWDYLPPLVVTELKINGKVMPPGVLATTPAGLEGRPMRLTLSPEQPDFALEFAALDFSDPKKNRYQYRLQGYNKTWIDTDSEHRSAAFGNLWPGRYLLQVRGSNRLGDWSPQELTIAIDVLPAWYQTWWFAVLLILAVTLAVVALVQGRTRYLRQRQVLLEQQVLQRTSDLQQKRQELLVSNQEFQSAQLQLSEKQNLLEENNATLANTLNTLQSTQKQLVEAEKMAALGALVAGVAHEINTPIGIGVTAASDLADSAMAVEQSYKAGKMKKADLEDFLADSQKASHLILHNLAHASDLVQRFKQVAVDQSSEAAHRFMVKTYLQEILDNLPPKLRQARIGYLINCPQDIEIESFPNAFAQVVTHIVGNAIVHAYDSGQNGTIKISVSHDDAGLLLLVFADHGKGIDEQHINKIFDPFFTTRRGTSEAGCSGLGLHIVYNLVTQTLRGSIRCNSVVGKGTEFIVLIGVV